MSSATVPAAAAPRDATAAGPVAAERSPFRLWFRTRGWRHLVLLLASAFALFPVVWILSASVNETNTLAASRLIPSRLTLENFQAMFNSETTPVGTWMWNSFRVGVGAAALNVLVAAGAAFAFSRMRFTGRRAILTSLLVMQIFPQFLGFVAFFALAQDVGEIAPAFGLNTHAFLLLVYLGGAAGFNAYLLKGFLDAIPTDLDEAARIDGATQVQLFWRIILPLARPMLAVVFIISFVAIFNEFILARVLLSGTGQLTLPVGLQVFLADGYNARWGLLAATALVGSTPILAVFLFAQKHIIGGLVQGAVKG